jgi:hypothetical protein
LLGDLAIKGKKKKLLPIIMWLYTHKNEGRELVIEKNHTHKNTLPKDTHAIQKKKKKPRPIIQKDHPPAMKKTPKENPKSHFLQLTTDLATSSHHSPNHHPSSATHLHPFSTLIFEDRGKKQKQKAISLPYC